MEYNDTCLIWETPAEFTTNNGGDFDIVNSSRVGGQYWISGTASAMIANFSEREKVLLTSWLIEQRRLGVKTPKINEDVLIDVTNHRLPTVHERADNLLRYLSKKSERLGNVIKFYQFENGTNSLRQETLDELLAWTSSEKTSEIITLAEYLSEQNWIEHSDVPNSVFHEIMLIPDGYARLAELDGINTNSAQCFVAMWFNDSMKDVYENSLMPAIKDCGYDPVRVDGIEHNGKIDDRIIAEIRRSRFIVADFTSEKDKPRGGVYYEAGFAHG
ncbi:MAG: hypothetical protein L3J21_12820, partial [Devosiaceae bacterium]|nr:hypothetical protein [Devosiaceae bacterium]